jgi:PBP1b-binding outer membrane lipoprotein LpoB
MKKLILLTLSGLFLAACSSHPVLPKKDDIKISRDAAGENCESLGFIEGRTTKINGKIEDALEDMKEEAIKKGANYVQIESMGALASSIRGKAYFCK